MSREIINVYVFQKTVYKHSTCIDIIRDFRDDLACNERAYDDFLNVTSSGEIPVYGVTKRTGSDQTKRVLCSV